MSPQVFPHLKPREGLLWAAWLQLHGTEYDRFDYDVHVGQGHPLAPGLADFVKVMIAKVSPQRIDVVGWKGGAPTIFEISPTAASGTWGNLFKYEYLFREQFPHVPAPALAYVTTLLQPDARRFLEARGVIIYVFQPLPPP